MYISVYITTADEDEAIRIGRALLEKRLVACINYLPVKSTYWWQGQLEDDNEILLICKTRQEKFEQIKELVGQLHSYDIPMIVAEEISDGNKAYLDWIDKNLKT